MDNFIPTPEQLAIERAYLETSRHLMLVARAGSAKTTTVSWIANKHMTKKHVCCLAFNVAIAAQLRRDMPKNADVRTINSICFDALAQRLLRKKSDFKINGPKYRNILRRNIKKLEETKNPHFEDIQDIEDELLDGINLARSHAYAPENSPSYVKKWKYKGLEDLKKILPERDLLELFIIDVTLQEGIEQGKAEYKIDLGDQIYLALLFKGAFTAYKYVIVDEAQDMAMADHMVLQELTRRRGRLIAVGDPLQSIYAFRGADPDSMDKLDKLFEPIKLPLTVCFRCPPAVVEEAKWRAEDLQVSPNPPSGFVRRWNEWTLDQIPDDALILCPRNAPLYALGMKMITEGRNPFFAGDSMLEPILRDLQRWLKSLPSVAAPSEVEKTIQPRLAKLNEDKQDAIMALCKDKRPMDIFSMLKKMMTQQETKLRLSTVHKAKGLGHSWVMILDGGNLFYTEETQAMNVLYVAQTRSKGALIYASSKNLREV